MIELVTYPTGRPVWVDPNRVAAIMDLVEFQPPRIAGAQPQITIIGAQVLIDGTPVPIAGEAQDVADVILAARSPMLATFGKIAQ